MKRTFLLLLLFATTGCASATDAKSKGADALNRGYPAGAYRLWLPLAESGDPEVQEAVALLLVSEEDLGLTWTPRAREEAALGWVVRSAVSGRESAMTWLGDAYGRGFLGLEEDPIAADCWTRAGAGRGLAAKCKRP